MRTLAIDLGARRVGLALSDAGGKLATPLEVIEVSSPQQAIGRILQVIGDEDVQRIVVGLPINMDDTLGPAATRTIEWARDLADHAARPVVFVDERLSTFQAQQDLIQRKRSGEKLTRKRQKEQLDALAAAAFLQAFLDGRLPAITLTGR
jgi:putative Holliday junction resolvase